MAKRLAQKLLLIGWDGADWQIIKPMLDRGEMPALASLISQGVMGNLASMQPMVSPMLWTTIATGKPPHVHGICGFYEPDAKSEKGVRAVASVSRKCKALWNILTQEKMKVNTVGWYVSHPAEPINGVCVSELFAKPSGPLDQGWPLVEHSVHPASLADDLAELRVHPQDIAIQQIEHFVPRVREITDPRDLNLSYLATQIAECGSTQAALMHVMKTQPWDVAMSYFNTIDHICHLFMYYHPPRLPQVTQEMFEMYRDVVEATYRFHDLMLAHQLEQAGPDATVMIISDHGYQTGDRRPKLTPADPTGPLAWHRPYGIFVLKGPHIRRDELIYGARLLDITPTVLTLMGLPIGEDMTGRPLLQVFEEPVTPDFIPSWEQRAGDAGMHSGDVRIDGFAEQAAMKQLADLGYIDPISPNREAAMERAVIEHRFNLARSLMGGRKLEEALVELKTVHKAQPRRLAVALVLADCYQKMGRRADCRELIDKIAAGGFSDVGVEDKNQTIIAQTDYMYGLLEMSDGNFEKAVTHLLNAVRSAGDVPGLHTQLGIAYVRLEQFGEAQSAFARALQIEPDDPVAHDGMATVHNHAKRFEDAADAALRSLAILYHQPIVHYHLGVAMIGMGELDQARVALQRALEMNPRLAEARFQLAALESAAKGVA